MNILDLLKRNMPVFIIGGITILVFLIIILTAQKNPVQNTTLIKVDKDELISPHTYTMGPLYAPVNIVEFADFECPSCSAFHPIMESIMEDYPDSVNWSFRHFPLPIHKNAEGAAIAAQAAGEQDKFWEYAKVLYENQSKLDDDSLLRYADLIGLNLDKFKEDINNKTFLEIVNDDVQYGRQIGVNATPTFFLNGEQLEINDYGDLRDAVENALQENNVDPALTTEVMEQQKADETQIKIIEEVDNRFQPLVVKYTEDGFIPRNTQASAGQMVKWENTTDKDITFIQLMPKFDELAKPFVIKAGETFEFRLRLRDMGLYTYKAEGDTTRASILINKLPPDLEDALPDEQ